MPTPPADLSRLSIDDIAALLSDQSLPPVERWHPEHCGTVDMRVAADGSWFHDGGRINRAAMVRMFSTILRREADGSYVLVTPGEKVSIIVEDLPFRAVEVLSEGVGLDRRLAFRLDTGDLVIAGADHPLSFAEVDGEPRPALHVRGVIGNGLTARIVRSVYYELVDMALSDGAEPPQIWSDGAVFAMSAA